MADSFELKAIITAVDRLSAPLKGMQRQLKGFQKELSGLTVGAGVAGSAILGAIAGASKEAMGLENNMADARKAIEELHDPKAFQKMTNDIVDMSTRLPMAAEGIAEIVAEAGNAGIPFNELTGFAEDATKAAVGFGMTAADAGHQLAVWRTSFKLTQDEVMTLSDQMNYLAMTGPTTEKKIGAVVTSVGNLATTAGVSTRDLAAIAATITGVGVDADVAGTGVQNFMLALTNANTGNAKAVLKAIGLTSEEVAKGMQKDSRGMMLRVLEGLSHVSKDKQAKGLEWLFGRESIKAIAPLLTNLDLLRKNFNAVSDASKYAGATQREYDSRVHTTEKQLQILKNQFTAMAITVGNEFLPMIVKAVDALKPFMKQGLEFIRQNPETVKSVAKLGAALLGVAAATGAVSRAIKIMNFAMNMSPAKAAIGLLVFGAYEIIEHWDEVGPVIKKVWQEIDNIVQKMGGWETAIKSMAALAALYIGVRFIANIRTAIGMQDGLTAAVGRTATAMKGIGTISLIAGLLELGQYAQKLEKEHPWLIKNFAADSLNSGFGLNDKMDKWGKQFHDFVYDKTGWQMPRADGYFSGQGYSPSIPLDRPVGGRSQSELTVTFENAPPGMRVIDPKSGDPFMSVKTDVAYSPFRNPR
ncbi:phage tail tape measure protein [Cronobacter sakazakii]|uniref:phage tail tape measure protein n=1 Tax=Cronobacter sakazakii TaxID=28141 RepID=UPI000CFCDF3A|nr:phage tail tape measure protein [Cronobacter sakazakii]PQY01238.1 phage tail tape measure protein [Cronobacter sakazakii]PRO53928.1 phage tail tape measure protein [Cronobacter sakazakii]